MEVVINNCFGGFSLSYEGVMKYAELCGIKVYGYTEVRDDNKKYGERDYKKIKTQNEADWLVFYLKTDLGDITDNAKLKAAEWFHERDILRHDKNLVKVVRALGKKANGRFANLKVVTIPKGVDYEIEEYDGNEHVAEKHRTWV